MNNNQMKKTKQIADNKMINHLSRNLDSAVEDKVLPKTEAGMIFARMSYAIMHNDGTFGFSGADLAAYHRFDQWCKMCITEQRKQDPIDAMLPVNNTVH